MSGANGLERDVAADAQPVWRRGVNNLVAAFTHLVRPVRFKSQSAWGLTLQQFAITAGLCVAVFLLVMVVADATAIKTVRQLPRWIVWFFNEITDFGKSGWFLWPLGVLFLVVAALPVAVRMQRLVQAAILVRVGFLFVAIAVPGLFVTIVKHMFGRARPMVGGSLDPYLFDPFTWPAAYASLPSGHATTAFSVLVAFGTLWPRARTILWLYALLIVISRVVVTAHYPSDVFAGALVGTVGALLVRRWFALRRLGFSVQPDGRVHQFPGPSPRRIKSVARAVLD